MATVGCGGSGGNGGIAFSSLGGGGGGTGLFNFLFCAMIGVEIVHTMNTSINFFIIKFLLRHIDANIP